MINYLSTTNKKIQAIFMVGFLFLVFLITAQPVEAATSTVRGIGWLGEIYQDVSFNCLDDVAGDRLDAPGNFHEELDPPGFRFFVDACQIGMQHAVEISENGNFSGSAWNSTLGFISFAGSVAPPDGYGSTSSSSHCPAICNASNHCWACYNETDQKVYGWARIDSSEEWLRLDSGLEPVPVSLQSCDLSSSVFPAHDIQPGDFVGYAASDSGNVDFTGTLSFNCESELGGSACATRNYKVYVSNLTLGKLTAPNLPNDAACLNARGGYLGWCKKSGTATAYEVMVSEASTPDPDQAICKSGELGSLASQYLLINCPLRYGINYYWWVRAYDENGVATDWYQYNTNSGTDTDVNIDGNPLTFTTYKHEFPSPYFSWAPFDVLVGTTTIFNALTSGYTSKFYTIAAPSLPQSCYGANCKYKWTTTDIDAIISVGTGATTIATTSIIFTQATGTSVTLGITDNENYYCSTSTTFKINYALPLWREVKAK